MYKKCHLMKNHKRLGHSPSTVWERFSRKFSRNLMFPWQSYFNGHVFLKFGIFSLLLTRFNFHAVSFTFLGLLNNFYCFDYFWAHLSSFGSFRGLTFWKNQEIQERGSNMADVWIIWRNYYVIWRRHHVLLLPKDTLFNVLQNTIIALVLLKGAGGLPLPIVENKKARPE